MEKELKNHMEELNQYLEANELVNVTKELNNLTNSNKRGGPFLTLTIIKNNNIFHINKPRMDKLIKSTLFGNLSLFLNGMVNNGFSEKSILIGVLASAATYAFTEKAGFLEPEEALVVIAFEEYKTSDSKEMTKLDLINYLNKLDSSIVWESELEKIISKKILSEKQRNDEIIIFESDMIIQLKK